MFVRRKMRVPKHEKDEGRKNENKPAETTRKKRG